MEFGGFLSKHFIGLWCLWLREVGGEIPFSNWVEESGVEREASGNASMFLMDPCPWINEGGVGGTHGLFNVSSED